MALTAPSYAPTSRTCSTSTEHMLRVPSRADRCCLSRSTSPDDLGARAVEARAPCCHAICRPAFFANGALMRCLLAFAAYCSFPPDRNAMGGWRDHAARSEEDDDDSSEEDRRLKAKKQKKPKPDPKPAPEPEPAPKRGAWSRVEPRRSARVNASGQSTDTPERRKPPRRRAPTPPQSTSRQAKRTTRVRPLVASLVAEILVSPDLLPHMLEHVSLKL